jgi:hypothetical protein
MVVTVAQRPFLATNSNTLTERTPALFGLPAHSKSHILTRSIPVTVLDQEIFFRERVVNVY